MKKRPLFKISNSEKGMALIAVLIVIVVASILGLSLMGLAASNVKMSTGERDNQSSYYIAESGATLLMSEITTKINDIYKNAKTSSEFYSAAVPIVDNYKVERQETNFEKNFGSQPVAKLKVEPIDLTNRIYKIISSGTVDNRTKTVEQQFQLRWSVNFPKTAVFVDNKIKVDSNASIINGSIGTNSIVDKAIELFNESSLQNGSEIIVGPNAPRQGQGVVYPYYSSQKIKVLDEEISLELKPFKATPAPTYPMTLGGTFPIGGEGNMNISSNTTISGMPDVVSINNVIIDNNTTLTIDVGAKDVEMFVKNFELKNNSVLYVKGSGKLHIYVDGSLKINNSEIKTENSQKDKIIIYLRKSSDPNNPKTVTASSSGTGINCSIFAEDALFDFTGGTFRGRFVTGGNVEVGGNNVIEGAIIAKNMHLKGSSSITFVEQDALLPLPTFKVNPIKIDPVREK